MSIGQTDRTIFALVATLASILAAAACRADAILIINAKLHTVIDPQPIEQASVLIVDGRIREVGGRIAAPAGAQLIDAAGHDVTPGFMNAATQLGLVEVSSVADSSDTKVNPGALGAAFDVTYALNQNSTLVARARADGLTRAVSLPGSWGDFATAGASAPFSGSGVVLKLVDGAGWIDRRHAAMVVVVGGFAASQVGGSRSAEWILLRNALDEAKKYRPSRGAGEPRDQLLNRLDIEALQPVVAGTMPLAIAAMRESDIRQAVAVGTDYNIPVIVIGGAEAWRVAGLLAERKVPVVLNPFDNLPWTFDDIGARADNAAILARAGVTIAFSVPGIHLSHDAGEVIREAAGVAVANGLPWADALRALTLNPARIWGIDDHYGRIAPGMDADLVIWDGDPLEPTSAPTAVFVAGRAVSLTTRQSLLRDRYSPLHKSEPWPPGYR